MIAATRLGASKVLVRLRLGLLEQRATECREEALLHDSLADGNRQAAQALHQHADDLIKRAKLLELQL